jgi:hypothetical protein
MGSFETTVIFKWLVSARDKLGGRRTTVFVLDDIPPSSAFRISCAARSVIYWFCTENYGNRCKPLVRMNAMLCAQCAHPHMQLSVDRWISITNQWAWWNASTICRSQMAPTRHIVDVGKLWNVVTAKERNDCERCRIRGRSRTVMIGKQLHRSNADG